MTGPERKFLVFSLHGSLFALDLAQVSEVADPLPLSPIPRAPAYYTGAYNFHGDIVAVLDLALFLGASTDNKAGKFITLHRDVASLTLLVEAGATTIVSEGDVSFDPPPPGNTFACATVVMAIGKALQIDLPALVRALELDLHPLDTKNTIGSKKS